MSLGPAPCDEKCAMVGEPDYYERARPESQRFIEAIRAKLGPEPPGARLKLKSCPHDFGTYLDVECEFDDGDEEARTYAYLCESEGPRTWDDTGPLAKKCYEVLAYLEVSVTVDAPSKHMAEVQGKHLIEKQTKQAGLNILPFDIDTTAREIRG